MKILKIKNLITLKEQQILLCYNRYYKNNPRNQNQKAWCKTRSQTMFLFYFSLILFSCYLLTHQMRWCISQQYPLITANSQLRHHSFHQFTGFQKWPLWEITFMTKGSEKCQVAMLFCDSNVVLQMQHLLLLQFYILL